MSANEKNTRTIYGVKVLNASHKDLRRLKKEHEPSIHGNKLWGSGWLLMDYLKENPPKKKAKIMDLGCGWGLNSVFCAKNFKAKVTAVDADPAVFPYVDLFAQHNGVELENRVAKFEKLSGKELAQYDMIIGADICFWDELGEVVYKLIKRARKAGVKKIVIADPQRSPFNEMADKCIDKLGAKVEYREIEKPRKATGDILIVG